MVTHRRLAKLPYVLDRPDKPGLYFNRRVPKDLRDLVGKEYWRWLLGHTAAEARLKLPEAIAYTDQVIADLRAGKTPAARPQHQGMPIPAALDRELWRGMPAADVYQDDRFFGTPDEAEEVAALPALELLSKTPLKPEELLELAKAKKPRISKATIHEWERSLRVLTDFLGHDNLHMVTRSDARAFRAHLVKTIGIGTVITRLGYVAGLFNAAFKDDRINGHPFLNIHGWFECW